MRRFLSGRRLTRKEIPFDQEIILEHEKQGYIQVEPGLSGKVPYLTCKRCNNQNPSLFANHPSPFSDAPIHYCRHCLSLGKISTTTDLLTWLEPPSPMQKIPSTPLKWEGTLSPGQKKASDQVISAIKERSSILVWAVCGAGKTEVLFRGIESALLDAKRVLLATPRTDVVKELAPRFKQAFPDVEQAALYGGHTKQDTTASLILATTHQVLRFYRTFDVVIVDEIDAFPFSFDPSLQYGVHQAAAPHASRVYLSATPSKTLLRSKGLEVVRIPRRYHGYDLPVPRLQWCGNWRKSLRKQRLPQVIKQWVVIHVNKRIPALLFVPSIKVLHEVSAILTSLSIPHAAVHSDAPDRHTHIQSFRDSSIPLLVTTTILERGITISKVEIGVLGAEADIFTEAALVQISGRVGRDKQFPQGDAVFFHYGRTDAMIAAKNHIKKMNELESGE
ncbi:DEAD/DEAH box helicase [Alkalicoccobacillus porphyridii]|uniref:DEAD/DEAH box helicase n=1 Tax=Alkalicoccobacillus porphyridii TaxID=2597270 RepID=A0A554A3W2_9BACI|nr:DEAD/DEAH box helicase family protein [Alkalicoccobacillus porphyridii]TSB48346.1 DEAD/DEAH box helicase [Alkalicoccobacillus porphyridii]